VETGSFPSLGPHGFHRIAYTEWGDPRAAHVVIASPGLTRNARDFDYLARALERDCRVICMDTVGRGASDRLEHKQDYGFRQYQVDAAALIARVTAPAARGGWLDGVRDPLAPPPREPVIDWVGTSMGGLIGMLLAARPRTPIRRLVLNDVGPMIPWSALTRLKGFVGKATRFPNLNAVEKYLREVCATFGPLEDEHWRHLATHSAEPLPNGQYELAYDPGIGESLWTGADLDLPLTTGLFHGVDLWHTWDAIRAPTLVIRGAESDVLTAETAARMGKRGPPTRVVTLDGIGHAPALMSADQIAIVRDFLLAPERAA
jgi:pimeloyl-ACP methyl ester carboxylesterase